VAVVVITLKSDVIAPWPCALVPAVTVADVEKVGAESDGVESDGVESDGLVAKTSEPDPVSSVTAAAKFAEEGVPNQVATPAPKLVIPVPPFATGDRKSVV
jgi:hypothetical protein